MHVHECRIHVLWNLKLECTYLMTSFVTSVASVIKFASIQIESTRRRLFMQDSWRQLQTCVCVRECDVNTLYWLRRVPFSNCADSDMPTALEYVQCLKWVPFCDTGIMAAAWYPASWYPPGLVEVRTPSLAIVLFTQESTTALVPLRKVWLFWCVHATGKQCYVMSNGFA